MLWVTSSLSIMSKYYHLSGWYWGEADTRHSMPPAAGLGQKQPSYSTVDARIAWSNQKWGIALVSENLTDEKYLTDTFDFLGDTVIRGPGRLIRLEATLNF